MTNRHSPTPSPHEEDAFAPILDFVHQARGQALAAVNRELVTLYWRIGEYLNHKIAADGWGQGTIKRLADWLVAHEPDIRGFSPQNLWRMRQFHETYREDAVLSPAVRELSWTHNLVILSKCRSQEERGFYLRLAIKERWTKRELERQLDGGLFERTLIAKPKLSPALREIHPSAESAFKDGYLIDFLSLPHVHSEHDLQKGLLANLKQFLLELGREFCFVGEEYLIQVGAKDFFVDLLFYHRGLQALVAFELKIDDFKPAYLGQLEFYLEALDRDHKKPHEAASIGVLLCKSRDHDVVEYALSRSLSPTLVAEYVTKLPDKHMLQMKLDEFYELAQHQAHQEREP
ncbi:MAG: PDDEXK nuclease domain-containing protein [Sulfuriferula sp.]